MVQNQAKAKILSQAHKSFSKGMNTYSHFKVSSDSTCDDLVQDTFVKTWNYMVKNGKVDNMKAFLYHILNQLIIDEYRKRKLISLDALLQEGFEISLDGRERTLNIYEGKAALLLVMQLPVRYQRIIKMRFVQELSLLEISLITGQTKNAIAVQSHRGLEQLKELYLKSTNAK
jgi:RNA polymerase sigma-70 factor, ECF subfamily